MVSTKSNIVARALLALAVAAGGSVMATDTVNAEPLVAQELKNGLGSKPATPASAASSLSAISSGSSPGLNQISIKTGVDTPRYSVTRVSNPERIVVDLDLDKLPNAKSFKTPELQYISGVRVGSHPGKTRIVVDLKNGAPVVHDARLDKGVVIVSLSGTPAVKSEAESVAKTDLPKVKTVLALDEDALVSGSSAGVVVSNPQIVSDEIAKQQVVLPQQLAVSPQVDASKKDLTSADRASFSFEKSPLARKFVSIEPDRKMSSLDNLQDELPLERFKEVQTKDNQPFNYVSELLNVSKSAPAAAVVEAKTAPVNEPSTNESANKQEVKTDEKLEAKPDLKPEVQPEVKPDLGKAVDSQNTDKIKDESSKISSVVIDSSASAVPAVVIGIKKDTEFSMTRTAPSEYVVTLKKVSATPNLLQQTMFAPPGSSGIRSARVVNEGGDALVRIFSQASSYLTMKRVGDTLRVEETQDLAQVARDIRAQIAPASAKEDDKQPLAKDSANLGKENTKPQNKHERTTPEQEFSGPDQSELAAINGSSSSYTGRLISLDLQDADIDSALRIIAEVSNLNIVASDGVVGKVTLKLVDVPWDQALEVILKSHGLDKVLEGNVLRVAPVDKLRDERESFKQARVAEEELEPLSVKYIRVSYAKASEIKTLVETVISERGTVAFDERSNQLVVKDTKKGLQNVTELIKKVDLRTPQILLETQIVEAGRNLSRKLGAELGFQYIQSPATGNGTGLNFPAAISMGGSADTTNPRSNTGSAFPVESTSLLGSAVTMLFDSADGTKSLALRLSQLEQEGQVRIISKPAVATTNNKPAEIKSVEKYRVKLPNGGLSIASGSGATSSGSGDVATQTIEAGIVLNVTPQASPDYYILLDIKAKSSSFGSERVDGIPNEIERSASSSVLVSSGQTFALGGIYKITELDSVAGVPFLKDIPVLGTFFRSNITEHKDEELLFFITPRIVEGSFEDATSKVVS
jgi:type IV pilus secretin PilQ/predicted competence protein